MEHVRTVNMQCAVGRATMGFDHFFEARAESPGDGRDGEKSAVLTLQHDVDAKLLRHRRR
jgi:hypothetical protein